MRMLSPRSQSILRLNVRNWSSQVKSIQIIVTYSQCNGSQRKCHCQCQKKRTKDKKITYCLDYLHLLVKRPFRFFLAHYCKVISYNLQNIVFLEQSIIQSVPNDPCKFLSSNLVQEWLIGYIIHKQNSWVIQCQMTHATLPLVKCLGITG